MKTLINPQFARVLICYHIFGEIIGRTENAPVMGDAHTYLLSEGALRRTLGSGYEITELGRAWVENMVSTPKPEVKYVDPRFK